MTRAPVSDRRLDVLAVGETMVMLVPSAPERLHVAEALEVHVGGAESNVACWLAADGFAAAWASRVGDDPFGRRVLAEIGSHGVDTSLVDVDPAAPTGVYFKDPGPTSTAVHYYRRGSAASRMNATTAAALPVGDARLLHLSGITPGLSDSCGEFADALVDAARAAGTPVSFDVNHRPGVWAAEAASERLRLLADRCDIVFVGLDEAATLWATDTPQQVRELLPAPERVVVKDGAVGATEFGPHGEVFVRATASRVVEAVGAGDAFAAGYLAALLGGAAAVEALQRGHDTAVRALAGTGDVNIDRSTHDRRA